MLAVGFVLQQQNGDNWALIQAGSRFLSDAESRYAVIELELLAVSWAIAKCKLFLAGLPYFTVVTDHHPLIPILNSHRLDEIENPRLQRLRNRIMAYNFTAQWVKGILNNAPDALSRNPVSDPLPHELMAEYDPQNHPESSIAEIRAASASNHSSLRLQDLRQHAEADQEYQQIQHYIRNGFPDHRHQLPEQCRRYWNVRSQLALDDGLIVYGCCLLIPSVMRPQVLQQLHESHQGATRTKLRAKLIVYWPGINNDIENVILSCTRCQEHLPSQPKEPIIMKPKPSRPFQEIAVDFCLYAGHTFLITVDCHTDWPDIVHMGHNATAPQLTATLLNAFCRTGAPDVVWSDQGPQFTSKLFNDFSKEWGFQHSTSSPTYPQSNGKAEAMHSQIYEKDHPSSMETRQPRRPETRSSSAPVPQHAFSAGSPLTNTEAFWPPHTGHTSRPSSCVRTAMADNCRRGRTTGHTQRRPGRTQLQSTCPRTPRNWSRLKCGYSKHRHKTVGHLWHRHSHRPTSTILRQDRKWPRPGQKPPLPTTPCPICITGRRSWTTFHSQPEL